MFSRNSQTKLACTSSGMASCASLIAMVAARDGISPSTTPNARFRPRSMVWCTWCKETAAERIYSAYGISKECARESGVALCAWDSGSATVMVSRLLTRTLVGTQWPGSMWKRYHPNRFKSHGRSLPKNFSGNNDFCDQRNDFMKL